MYMHYILVSWRHKGGTLCPVPMFGKAQSALFMRGFFKELVCQTLYKSAICKTRIEPKKKSKLHATNTRWDAERMLTLKLFNDGRVSCNSWILGYWLSWVTFRTPFLGWARCSNGGVETCSSVIETSHSWAWIGVLRAVVWSPLEACTTESCDSKEPRELVWFLCGFLMPKTWFVAQSVY